jgi:lambda repressor-like predicted transcriptional regulator
MVHSTPVAVVTAPSHTHREAHTIEDLADADELASAAQNNGTENPRSAFIMPLLDKKGWSILDWANHSNVDFHTANDYLKGKTKPFRSTRKQLANSLGIEAGNLPK